MFFNGKRQKLIFRIITVVLVVSLLVTMGLFIGNSMFSHAASPGDTQVIGNSIKLILIIAAALLLAAFLLLLSYLIRRRARLKAEDAEAEVEMDTGAVFDTMAEPGFGSRSGADAATGAGFDAMVGTGGAMAGSEDVSRIPGYAPPQKIYRDRSTKVFGVSADPLWQDGGKNDAFDDWGLDDRPFTLDDVK